MSTYLSIYCILDTVIGTKNRNTRNETVLILRISTKRINAKYLNTRWGKIALAVEIKKGFV